MPDHKGYAPLSFAPAAPLGRENCSDSPTVSPLGLSSSSSSQPLSPQRSPKSPTNRAEAALAKIISQDDIDMLDTPLCRSVVAPCVKPEADVEQEAEKQQEKGKEAISRGAQFLPFGFLETRQDAVFACSLVSCLLTSLASLCLALTLRLGEASHQTRVAWPSAPREQLSGADPCYLALKHYSPGHQFQALTGKMGHQLPEMYGKVREKTIWSYWYDAERCPSRARCELPPHIQLCAESVHKNRGSFDYRIIFLDEVDRYVSFAELPLHFRLLRPRQQRDALMNALLARYGGVALDMSTVLFETLDPLWDEMVEKRATFRGLAYRINGEPWGRPEVTASWYMMSRREGLLSMAVLNQFTSLCNTYLRPELSLGDRAITPTLRTLYNVPECTADSSVEDKEMCPEWAAPSVWAPDRNDRRVLMSDPRDGPELPFARVGGESMGAWRVSSDRATTGYCGECCSMRSCWEVFERRMRRHDRPRFVKLFNTGGELWQVRQGKLLADNGTFFYQWLRRAGLSAKHIRTLPERGLPDGLGAAATGEQEGAAGLRAGGVQSSTKEGAARWRAGGVQSSTKAAHADEHRAGQNKSTTGATADFAAEHLAEQASVVPGSPAEGVLPAAMDLQEENA